MVFGGTVNIDVSTSLFACTLTGHQMILQVEQSRVEEIHKGVMHALLDTFSSLWDEDFPVGSPALSLLWFFFMSCEWCPYMTMVMTADWRWLLCPSTNLVSLERGEQCGCWASGILAFPI